ncbi:MAG: hydrolase [Bacteroidetes bacterium]|nr:MAG: hydrolase [Bacteroidota bacterium]
MRIKKENTIGVVIDIQSRLYPVIQDADTLTKNNTILIKGLRVLHIPIVVTQQYTKGLGETIPELAEALGEYKHIEKTAFSCCDEPRFNEDLALASKMYVVVTGIEAHVCVMQTVNDLIGQGYIPVVVEDCIGSRNPNDKKIAIERMRQSGAIITTYESILFELLKYSGTDQFREISQLVK